MENASKALIIAGAILITIVVISLGVVVFQNMSASARNQADMTEQQIASFNSKLTPYFGNNISGSQVNTLLDRVMAINQTAKKNEDTTQRVSVYIGDEGSKSSYYIKFTSADANILTGTTRKASSGTFYKVTGVADSNGLFTEIYVKE